MKTILIFCLSISIVILSQCGKDPNCHNSIYVKNNTSKVLYIDSSLEDTTINPINTLFANPDCKTSPYSTNIIEDRECYDKVMNQGGIDTINIFIFDAEIVETVPWDTIYKHYMILKRYDLSYADLVNLNWTITYP